VAAPLVAVDVLEKEADPALRLADPIAEATRLCSHDSLGLPGVAFHISNGLVTQHLAGEAVPISLVLARQNVADRVRALVREVAGDSADAAQVSKLATAILTLDNLTCASIVGLLGGRRATILRGAPPSLPGTPHAGVPGSISGETAGFSIPKGLTEFCRIIESTIGRFAPLIPGREPYYGLPQLATDLHNGAGAADSVVTLDHFLPSSVGTLPTSGPTSLLQAST
jgi:hypothetical protein